MRHKLGRSWWERHYRFLSLTLFFCVVVLLVRAAQLRLSPVVSHAVQAQGKNYAIQLINEQVQNSLWAYDGSFSEVERAADGKILSIGLDAAKANRLKAELAFHLAKEIDNLAACSIKIPLGTLLGGALLSGRGPKITFIIAPYSSAEVSFEQGFASAGINQTVYRVGLRVKMELVCVMGSKQIISPVETTFLLEERLIAGEVPQVYLGKNDLSEKSFDFLRGN